MRFLVLRFELSWLVAEVLRRVNGVAGLRTSSLRYLSCVRLSTASSLPPFRFLFYLSFFKNMSSLYMWFITSFSTLTAQATTQALSSVFRLAPGRRVGRMHESGSDVYAQRY